MVGHRKEIFESILSTCPAWTSIRERDEFEIHFIAQIERGSGKLTRAYDLLMKVWTDERVTVQEVSKDRLLPISCPQRHINADETFCVGLRADYSVKDTASAEIWWQRLAVFLACQETAEESRKWPPMLQVSHGEAADLQLEAEELARKLDLAKAYEMAVAYDEGSIAALSKHVSRITGRLPRPRMLCACGYTDNGHVKSRQQCAGDNNLCLPVLEYRRRRAEMSFWREARGRLSCCGAIDDCPLK